MGKKLFSMANQIPKFTDVGSQIIKINGQLIVKRTVNPQVFNKIPTRDSNAIFKTFFVGE